MILYNCKNYKTYKTPIKKIFNNIMLYIINIVIVLSIVFLLIKWYIGFSDTAISKILLLPFSQVKPVKRYPVVHVNVQQHTGSTKIEPEQKEELYPNATLKDSNLRLGGTNSKDINKHNRITDLFFNIPEITTDTTDPVISYETTIPTNIPSPTLTNIKKIGLYSFVNPNQYPPGHYNESNVDLLVTNGLFTIGSNWGYDLLFVA